MNMTNRPADEDGPEKPQDTVDGGPSNETREMHPESSREQTLGPSHGHLNSKDSRESESAEQASPSRWIRELLDSDSPVHGSGLPEEPTEKSERQHAADLLFVDALLRETLAPARDAKQVSDDPSLRAVFARIRSPELVATSDAEGSTRDSRSETPRGPVAADKGTAHRRRSRWPLVGMISSFGVVAALLVGAFFVWTPTDRAVAALATIRSAAAKPVDLEYNVRTELGSLLNTDISTTLFVRGEDKFAFRQPAPLGTAWMGSDGDFFWLIPGAPVGPILISENPAMLEKWKAEKEIGLPFLQVTAVLERLAKFYDLRLVTHEEEIAKSPETHGPHDDRESEPLHVHGTLRVTSDSLAPKSIDVWADPQTGMLQRMILDWHRDPSERGVRRIEFNLKGEQHLPADWYDPTKHIAPHRAVLKL